MYKISTAEFRDNLARYLGAAYFEKKTVSIYKYGKLWAVLTPPKEAEPKKTLKDYFGVFAHLNLPKGTVYENRIRRNKHERTYVKLLRKGIT